MAAILGWKAMSDPALVMAQRYGAPSRGRRAFVVTLAALFAAAGLAWVAWAALTSGPPLVSSQLVSFTVPSEHSAQARVVVARRRADLTASCLLRASAVDHTVVGELNFTVGPSSPATVTLHKDVRTERAATTLDLIGCVTKGQDRRH
jgi:hypothetical protein